MADLDALELDALWAEFHTVVNMTSQEMTAWLRTSGSAAESAESAEVRQGRGVLALLYKRPIDLTDADVRLMYEVVETIQAERAAGPRADVSEADWRYRLMTLGHDPLRG
jgi:uncharacterized protein DUF3140